MAAIKITAESSWKVANWVYQGVMDEVLHGLAPDTDLAHAIKETIDSNVLFFSYFGLSTDARTFFQEALEQGLANALSKGTTGFAQPEHYAAFIEQFRELIRLVKM